MMKIRTAEALLFLVLGLPPLFPQTAKEFPRLAGPYLGQKPPGATPELFAPGIVSTGYFEHSSPVFTPDLKEIYWSTQLYDNNRKDTAKPIYVMKSVDGIWRQPEIPAFAQPFACAESPFISPDGKKLFFHASRTLRAENAAIYSVDRAGDGWGSPVKLDGAVNASGQNVEPTVSKEGTLYFVSDYRQDLGIYFSKLVEGRYQKRVPLEEKINSLQTDWTPYIAPDESYLIFCSFREGGFGSGDLYICFKRKDGSWGDAINMGDKINTPANESFPNVTPDGKYLFFNSTKKIPGAAADAPGNGDGDVYWIEAKIIEDLRKASR